MREKEKLNEYGLTFGFRDGENPIKVIADIHEIIHERYEGVKDLEISQMGGTTFITTFDAVDEKELKSIFDANEDEERRRLLALDHILN